MIRALLRSAQLSPIGLDVAHGSLNAVQVLRDRRDATRVHAACSIPRLEPGSDLSARELLRAISAIGRKGFDGRRVVVCAPTTSLLSGVLELPPLSSGAPVTQIAQAEMSRTLKRDAGTFEMAHWEIPSPPRGSEGSAAMAVALPHDTAGAMIGVLESAGCECLAIDARPWALARACGRGKPGLVGVVELDWSGGQLVLLDAGRVIYERHIEEWSLKALHESLANVLEADVGSIGTVIERIALHEDSNQRGAGGSAVSAGRRCFEASNSTLARELGVSLSYIAHRFARASGPAEIDSLLVCGPGAAVPGIANALIAQLQLPVSIATPNTLADVSETPGRWTSDPSLVVALGLSLWRTA